MVGAWRLLRRGLDLATGAVVDPVDEGGWMTD